MPQVQVTATAKLRCQNERGQFYYPTFQITITTAEQLDNAGYIAPLYNEANAQGLIPDNCTGLTWQVDEVIPIEGPQLSGQMFTAYIHVYCIRADGTEDGPTTQVFDFPIDGTVDDFIAMAKAIAGAWCDQLSRKYRGFQFVDSRYVLLAPAYYQYERAG
jgi:hypothetical protein